MNEATAFGCIRKLGTFLALLLLAVCPARAEEKGGLLVDVQKKVLSRNDQTTPRGVGNVNVSRTLSLKVDLKNVSMRDMPETKISYIVLIQRWGSETGNIERYVGEAKMEAMNIANGQSVTLGEFPIGGHLHGSSEHHVDHMLAWKVVIERDGKKLDFSNTGSFDALSNRARPGSKRAP